MNKHRSKEISWGLWAILVLNGAYHAWDKTSKIILFVLGFLNWGIMMWHGYLADKEER